MLTVVIVIHLMLVIALIGVVLLQKSEGGGLVSSTSGFLSSRGTANVLTRATALLAAGFFATSLALSWLASFERKPASIINPGAPAQESPGGTPFAPLSQSGGHGVLNQLEHNGPVGAGTPAAPPSPGAPAPAAPAPSPSAPQVPESR